MTPAVTPASNLLKFFEGRLTGSSTAYSIAHVLAFTCICEPMQPQLHRAAAHMPAATKPRDNSFALVVWHISSNIHDTPAPGSPFAHRNHTSATLQLGPRVANGQQAASTAVQPLQVHEAPADTSSLAGDPCHPTPDMDHSPYVQPAAQPERYVHVC
jgi:hypothetical protein